MSEQWDVYNINRQKVGRLHTRGTPLKEGDFHIVVEILVINMHRKCLVTKRHESKPHGGEWEWTGGSVLAGETSLNGAIREVYEETGLVVKPEQMEYSGTVISLGNNSIYDNYIAKIDFSESDIRLQEGETVDFKLLSIDEFFTLLKSGEFIESLYCRHRGTLSKPLSFE